MRSLEVVLDGDYLVFEKDDFHFRLAVPVDVSHAGNAQGGLEIGFRGVA